MKYCLDCAKRAQEAAQHEADLEIAEKIGKAFEEKRSFAIRLRAAGFTEADIQKLTGLRSAADRSAQERSQNARVADRVASRRCS